jgi:hypothetical protein
MIDLNNVKHIYVACGFTDLRKGIDGYLMAANDTVDEKGKRIYDVVPKGDWRIFGVVDYVIHAPVCDEL